jgi:hypothetical protein
MRAFQLLTALCVFSLSMVAADNPFVGTWKLNTEKSKFAPGTAYKEMNVTFEAAGDQMKRTVTGVDPDGEQVNTSSLIPWDGNFHKIDAPDGPAISVAVKKLNDRTLNVKVKQEEKVVDIIRAAVSKDGKTMTVTEKGEDPKGRKLDNVEVFEKQ